LNSGLGISGLAPFSSSPGFCWVEIHLSISGRWNVKFLKVKQSFMYQNFSSDTFSTASIFSPAAGRWLLDILSLKNYNDHRMLKMKIEKKVKELIKQIHSELEKKFKKKLAKIILFGSYARGDYDKESDLDILVLIEEENPQKYRSEIVDLEVDLTIKYGILPSLILRNTGYFLENKDVIPFFKYVEKEGVEIYAA
jgi:predicted nucleotidyltransferase